MEKMITVINDNLTSVITGIKEHKEDLQRVLEKTKNDMSNKVSEANRYKDEVENARVIISTLEDEITDLENNLAELNRKFNSKDFKQILTAGNKEINAKIVEKRNLISEQGRIIIDLTDKAKTIKEELLALKEKKKSTEENLEKTYVLERYYELRVTEVIDFANENASNLDQYMKEIPQDDLDVNEEIVDVDITNIADGAVFEEIDEISTSEPDEELLASVLANPDAIDSTSDEEETIDVEELIESDDIKEIDEYEFPLTDKLEDMITEAKSIIARNSTLVNVEAIDEEDDSVEEMADLLEETVNEEVINDRFPDGGIDTNLVQAAIDFDDVDSMPYVVTNTVSEIQTAVDFAEAVADAKSVEVEEEKEDVIVGEVEDPISFGDEEDRVADAITFDDVEETVQTEENIEISSDIFEETTEKTEEVSEESDVLDEDEDTIDIFVDEDEEEKAFDSSLIIDLEGNVISDLQEENEETTTEEVVPEVVPDVQVTSVMDVIRDEPMADLDAVSEYSPEEMVNDQINLGYDMIVQTVQDEINSYSADENVVDESAFLGISEGDFDTDLAEAGLEKALFDDDDLILLQTGFDKENAKRIIDIMNKYELDVNKIYKNVRILMYVSPENLDKLITLLITSGASNKDVNMLFDCFDKVNLGKFEQEIMTSSDPVLTQMLYDSLPVNDNEVIGEILGLSIAEVNILKKHAKDDDYAIMNTFPEIVKANFEELKSLNVDNLMDCLTKHPHRFTLVPSKFHDILDKYDTEDLIRCINKNAAVIDKL